MQSHPCRPRLPFAARTVIVRRLPLVASISLIVATIAGCENQIFHAFGLTMTSVSGRLIRAGGPASGAPVPLPGHVTVIRNPGGRPITILVGKNGRFRISLTPGTYEFTGGSPRVRSNNAEMPCRASHPVRVRKDHPVAAIEVICSIR